MSSIHGLICKLIFVFLTLVWKLIEFCSRATKILVSQGFRVSVFIDFYLYNMSFINCSRIFGIGMIIHHG